MRQVPQEGRAADEAARKKQNRQLLRTLALWVGVPLLVLCLLGCVAAVAFGLKMATFFEILDPDNPAYKL